jgi:hypothetical protein
VVYDMRKRQIKGGGAKCNFPQLDMGGQLGERCREPDSILQAISSAQLLLHSLTPSADEYCYLRRSAQSARPSSHRIQPELVSSAQLLMLPNSELGLAPLAAKPAL